MDKKYLLKTIFFGIYVLLFTLYASRFTLVHAQELSLSISPPILEVLVKPGKSLSQTFKITNNGEDTIVTPKIVEITENGVKENSQFKAEDWFSLLNTDIALEKPFLLKHNESRQLILRVSPPRGAEEKDYYRALLLTTTPTASSEYTQTAVSGSIGSVLLVTVSTTGLLSKEAKIETFEVPTIIDSFSTIPIRVVLKNIGKTYFHPNGTLTLTGPVGKAAYQIVPEVIFPEQSKTLKTENISERDLNISTLTISGFFIGKYDLNLDLTLDESTIKIHQKHTIYALPWKMLLIIISLIIVIFVIRRKRRHNSNNAKKPPIGEVLKHRKQKDHQK